MSIAPTLPPEDKRDYIAEIGRLLLQQHGKRKFYAPVDVKQANDESSYAAYGYACWGMCVFSSHEEFDRYHETADHQCSYYDMRRVMLEDIAGTDADWDVWDIADIDLDTSWLDFDSIGEGIGKFFASIFESIPDSISDWDD